ncbi:tetratricopeptide repeat protein [Ramlibacter tataouinensis]|uniref:nuclear transport factor 2 family protein n=1 Tax=Ramlibacter tataouinensis TaxID=94132 RepID=UPI0022F381BA|nr:tetratricopeptide repeat protein [Ramlibacter tataouinensis]WBY01591.1 tetratricopeptide repeat protein [Ramlibacter tataouinensis]
MSHARLSVPRSLRLLALAAAIAAPVLALADDYADVNQLLRNGRQADALAKADQYLAAKPRDPQMRFLRGVILTESGKTQDAIATFVKLTEDYPELPEPYNNLAVLYAGQSQFDKARAALEMAIRTNPSYATAHENLGDVYAKLASQAYSKALQLDAGNTAVQPKLGLIRELFAPAARGAKPAAAAPAPSPAPAAVAAAPAPAAAPPAPAAAPTPAPAAKAPAASPAPAPAAPASDAAARDVEAAVLAWAKAWSAKDMGAYLAAYGKEFAPPGKQTRKAWEDERRSRIVPRSRIAVRVSDLDVDVDGSKAVAKFRQAYSADGLNINGRKTLELHKVGDRWLIVRESVG